MDNNDIYSIALELAKKVALWNKSTYKKFEFANDLCGMCAISAAKTQNLYLKKYKDQFEMEICYNRRHCFNLINGYLLVDCTAKQFNHYTDYDYIVDNIYDLKEGDLDGAEHWTVYKKYKSISGLIERMKKDGWIHYQIPPKRLCLTS